MRRAAEQHELAMKNHHLLNIQLLQAWKASQHLKRRFYIQAEDIDSQDFDSTHHRRQAIIGQSLFQE
jgi:hypothetical protein